MPSTLDDCLLTCNHHAAVYATANVSGGHVNPAVTLANCLTGHTSWGRGGLYMVAQLLGAIFGALIEVLFLTPARP